MTRSLYFQWLAPLPLFILAVLLLEFFNLDLWVADKLYALEGAHWNLKDSWLLETVMHKDGKNFVVLLVLCSFAALASTWFSPRMRHYRGGLGYLVASVAISLVLISTLKNLTHIPCPWDLQRYGGAQPYIPVFHALFGAGSGRCFPAGHASGAYAWVALYFFCRVYKPQWRMAALAFTLLLGMSFGIAQQLRGAHFLSHDVWTLAICWYISLAGYSLLYGRRHRSFSAESVKNNALLESN